MEFLGRHPLVTGILALLGIAGLVLSIVSYHLDRKEAKDTTSKVADLDKKIAEISQRGVDPEAFSPDFENLDHINNLPLINQRIYQIVHTQYWDTDRTGLMIEGNLKVQDLYLDVAVQLARKYYPPGHFREDPDAYFQNKVNQEMAGYRSLARTMGGGLGMDEVLGESGSGRIYLEDQIKEMVRHVAANNRKLDFDAWESEWEAAKDWENFGDGEGG